MTQKLLVLDGSSLIHRAFYALPLLQTQSGLYTNAVYGFSSMLIRLIAEGKPDMVVVAFDKSRVTFRNKLYPEYKGQRKATPPELSQQFPLVKEILVALGIAMIEQEGYEADDIIGTLAAKASKAKLETVIVTGDRDALQLIDEYVHVMMTRKGVSEIDLYDVELFEEKYGFSPDKLVDLKGLMGDSSDNIPGVPGIGEKTAGKLIREYHTVENVLANIDNLGGVKLQERLRENADLALLSKQLATIECNMPLDVQLADFVIRPVPEKIKELFTHLEFKSLLNRLMKIMPETCSQDKSLDTPEAHIDYSVVDKVQEVLDACEIIATDKIMICYPVMGGATSEPILQGIAVKAGKVVLYLPAGGDGWVTVKSILENEAVDKITYDAKVLVKACHSANIQVNGLVFDALIAAYLLDPTAAEYPIRQIFEKYTDSSLPALAETAEEEACVVSFAVAKLYPIMHEALSTAGLESLNKNIELPLVPVLCLMEKIGIKVDGTKLTIMLAEISARVETLLIEIYQLAEEEFNVNSTKQLGYILFEKLNLPSMKKTKTGYSTDAEVLEMLSGQHPIIDKLLEYRVLTKLKTTYLEGLRGLINQTTGRIHTTFNQTVTATGRLSSSDPNLQNIPVRTEIGRRIRELFIPGDDWKHLLSADYSQIELRLLAHMSADPNLLEAFNHNQDVHTRTASEVFDIPLSDVTAQMRSRAKAVNFGIIYGISDYGLSRDLKISRQEAGQYIDSYFSKYKGVKEYIDKVVKDAHREGFVLTLFGRRRYLPDINSSNFNRRSFAERTAMNTPIQGTAADVIKRAMIQVHNALRQKQLKSRLLLQVHDELILEVTDDEIDIVTQLVQSAMENVIELSVPLRVDVNLGRNWAEAK